MKKKSVLSILLALIFVFTTVSTVLADEYIDDIPNDAHKVKNKWDVVGSYTSDRDFGQAGRTWSYEIHIKQAMYGPYSKGVVTLTSGDDVITAHIEDFKEDYHYWTRTGLPLIVDNFAAVGWAELNGQVYNFMLLYAEGGFWIILSHNSYDARWAAGDVYQGAERAAQVLLSNDWPPESAEFEFDPKTIH
ncbi:MAG: hypothetical protein JXB49_21965 [Bacteroidales bacterium]|nr:hypothetical protein [Bacteroidales bacterium]